MYTYLLVLCSMFFLQTVYYDKRNRKQTPWPLVRKRNIPTERPPLVTANVAPSSPILVTLMMEALHSFET
jgi:hypothetical protein